MELIRKLFPFTSWFPIPLKEVRQDIITGITVALVLIPQSMAYAQLAGLPAYYGLYAAFIPGIVGALWGSSRHLASGPTAVTSLLTATVLLPLALPGTPHYITLAVAMACIIGIFRLIIGLFKLTSFANFISLPVIRGFTNAAAFIIAFSQLHKLLGLQTGRTDFFLGDIWNLLLDAGQAHLPSLAIGVGSIAVIFFLRTFAPRVPFAILTAAAAAGAVYFLELKVEVIGVIPRGLPAFQIPGLRLPSILQLIPGSLLVLFISFMEICSVTRAVAARSKQRVDLNQEMVGQGLAAFAGGFFQSYSGGGSFSRTALTWAAGGKTSLAAIISGGMVVLTLLFFTPYLYYLPQATLAAVIIVSVIRLIDFRAVMEAWRVHTFDGIVSVATFAATLLLAPNMVYGILVGIFLSLLFHLIKVVGGEPGELNLPDLIPLPENDPLFPVFQFSGRLYFARSSLFEEGILALDARYPQSLSIIVDGTFISEMDATGERMLHNLAIHLREGEVDLVFSGLQPPIHSLMRKTGLEEIIGEDRFYPTVEKAVEGEKLRMEKGQ